MTIFADLDPTTGELLDWSSEYSLAQHVPAGWTELPGVTSAMREAFVRPGWNGTALIELATNSEWETAVRTPALNKITVEADAKLIAIHGGTAAFVGHLNKRMDANAHKGGAFSPKADRSTVGPATPHLDAYILEQGGDPTVAADRNTHADAILAAESADATREANLERWRKKAVDAINAATVGDTTVVNAALATWETDLATV